MSTVYTVDWTYRHNRVLLKQLAIFFYKDKMFLVGGENLITFSCKLNSDNTLFAPSVSLSLLHEDIGHA